ncbi:MAG: hypothetical protein AB1295_02290 [Candidatus Micrarchaeota archaeon]
MAAKNDKMGKVLPFPAMPRKLAADPLEGKDPAIALDKEACITLLEGFARVPGSLVKALALPEKLFRLDEGPSVSSDPKEGISRIAKALVAGDKVTSEMLDGTPEYAIAMTYRSSSSFCVLLDKRRKILVMAELGNTLGSGLSWEPMTDAINEAVASRDKKAASGERFNIIFCQDFGAQAI